MFRSMLILVLIFTVTYSFADIANQTSWVGGPYHEGPVDDWGDEFFTSDSVFWSNTDGTLTLRSVVEHEVTASLDNPSSAVPGDMDGDGDFDIVATSHNDDMVIWYENMDGFGTSWSSHLINESTYMALGAEPADMDGDGDLDVVASSWFSYQIAWWENVNGSGTSWMYREIGNLQDACLYPADVDGDGDVDVLSSCQVTDEFAWWENLTGSGTTWSQHVIIDGYNGASGMFPADADGDGDLDLFCTDRMSDRLTCCLNMDGSGTSWVAYVLDSNFEDASSVYAGDVDSDGDVDAVCAGWNGDHVAWWENTNGAGTSWQKHMLLEDFNGPSAVWLEDLDSDGDNDILTCATADHKVLWLENSGSTPGTEWTEHPIDEFYHGAGSVCSEDINDDGNPDVIGCSSFFDLVSWWNLLGSMPVGHLESSILDGGGYIPQWDLLSWMCETPAGTSVALQVRSSSDSSDMGDWSELLTVSPTNLTTILEDSTRYFQYRITLESTNPDVTPIFEDILVEWSRLGISDEEMSLPVELSFVANPSSAPSARLEVSNAFNAELFVMDMTGRVLYRRTKEDLTPGIHTISVPELASGIYICRVAGDAGEISRRFAVVH